MMWAICNWSDRLHEGGAKLAIVGKLCYNITQYREAPGMPHSAVVRLSGGHWSLYNREKGERS